MKVKVDKFIHSVDILILKFKNQISTEWINLSKKSSVFTKKNGTTVKSMGRGYF